MEEQIIELRKSGKSYNLIARELGLKRDRVRYVCRKNNMGGSIGGSCFNKPLNVRREKFKIDFNSKFEKYGFVYYGEFTQVDKSFLIRCLVCDDVSERSAQMLRRNKVPRCVKCGEVKSARSKLLRALNDRIEKLEKEQKVITNIKVSNEIKSLRRIHRNHKYRLKCHECGRKFFDSVESAACGVKCKNKRNNRIKDLRRRKRLTKNGAVDWDITIDGIINRDGKQCHLCLSDVSLNDYGIRSDGTFIAGDNYPSIDHVVPVSKGGTHTWDNVKLAHRLCNSYKSDNEVGLNINKQLTLLV